MREVAQLYAAKVHFSLDSLLGDQGGHGRGKHAETLPQGNGWNAAQMAEQRGGNAKVAKEYQRIETVVGTAVNGAVPMVAVLGQ